jgi:predicted phosphate transport protein (TIGR00153 family)
LEDVTVLGISKELAAAILEYAEEVYGIVEKLRTGIKLLKSMNTGESMKELANAIKADTKADAMRREILLALTEVRGGYVRERVARLVRRLDLVSEQTKEAARDLTLLPYFELPAEIKEVIDELSKDVQESVKALLKSLTALMNGKPEEAIKISRSVEEIEEEADNAFLMGKRLLMKYGSKVRNAAIILMLFNFMQSLENVTDYSEDAGDYIRTLALREKSGSQPTS